jgi:predicted metal-dependent peptidase
MELSNEQIKGYIRRLLLSRMRILNTHGFYGLLLMHMVYSIDENAETAYTDGTRIAFGPEFLESLTDSELDFVMMHEILHVVLQHCIRGEDRDHERMNIACDIVVNSNILLENNMDRRSITLSQWGESMHIAPDGKEGHEYTAEQVYDMLPPTPPRKKKKIPSSGMEKGRAKQEQGDPKDLTSGGHSWDDHSQWSQYEEDDTLRDVWVKQFAEACEAISIREKTIGRGTLPLFAQRLLEKLRDPQVDWRTILNEFVQEEVNDYSFSPPDRRFQESPFFLPDFNELGKNGEPVDILFMIDTSGSMSDKEITAAFSEVKGAIDQFDGKLKGWLGFFDAAIIEPKPFESVDDVLKIKPAGGGGTDFQIIFEYVHQHMENKLPACIIILTDGYAPFPQEHLARDIPVLWLIDNNDIEPPWGKVARIKV